MAGFTPDGLTARREGESLDAVVCRFIAENAGLWDLQVLADDARTLTELLPEPEVEQSEGPNGHIETRLTYLFPTSYNFNDYNTGKNLLTWQAGGTAGTAVDVNAGSRKCYPVATNDKYKFGHPLYQATWESARGRHCHGAACVDLAEVVPPEETIYATFYATRYFPSDTSGTLQTLALWMLIYFHFYVSEGAHLDRAALMDHHNLYDYSPAIVGGGNNNP